MRFFQTISTVMLFMLFSGCTAPVQTTQALKTATLTEAEPVSSPVISTSMGVFEIVSTRLVDEANSTKANPGEKILLVGMTLNGISPELGSIPLDEFRDLTQSTTYDDQVHVTGTNDLNAISTMAGWVNDEFVMGFVVPDTASEFLFYWPGQEPIDLIGYFQP